MGQKQKKREKNALKQAGARKNKTINQIMIMDINPNILCGNDESELIYEITDLVIGFLVAVLNVIEIVIIARIKKGKNMKFCY